MKGLFNVIGSPSVRGLKVGRTRNLAGRLRDANTFPFIEYGQSGEFYIVCAARSNNCVNDERAARETFADRNMLGATISRLLVPWAINLRLTHLKPTRLVFVFGCATIYFVRYFVITLLFVLSGYPVSHNDKSADNYNPVIMEMVVEVVK